jgi:hypothetical protein
MFRNPYHTPIRTISITCLIISVLITGCASTPPQSGSQTGTVAAASGPAPLYYDFGDVLVPKEMSLIKKESFVYLSSGVTAGVLSFKGRVDLPSLITFFENNMAKDNWRFISSFRSPKNMMLFQKDNRWCVINIKEGWFKAYLEIWVAPTMNGSGSGSGLFK